LKKWLFTLLAAVFVLAWTAACSTNSGQTGSEQSSSGGSANNSNAKAKKITLAYVAWDSEIASTHVVKEVLENKLGYEVKMLQVDAGPMWAGVADGSADAMVAAWLPTLHADYYSSYEGNFEDLGPNLDGTKSGLVVPAYVEADSIEDLKDAQVAQQFGYKIIGIEPGAGVMQTTEKAIEQYGLEGWELVESSSAAMAAELTKAYENNAPIIVTGWTPHWKFSKFDLKYLDDPQQVYGGAEQIHTIVRQGLKEDMPDAYRFLDQFNWSPDDMADVMIDIADGASPEEAAKKWMESHEQQVNEWLQGTAAQ